MTLEGIGSGDELGRAPTILKNGEISYKDVVEGASVEELLLADSEVGLLKAVAEVIPEDSV